MLQLHECSNELHRRGLGCAGVLTRVWQQFLPFLLQASHSPTIVARGAGPLPIPRKESPRRDHRGSASPDLPSRSCNQVPASSDLRLDPRSTFWPVLPHIPAHSRELSLP